MQDALVDLTRNVHLENVKIGDLLHLNISQVSIMLVGVVLNYFC